MDVLLRAAMWRRCSERLKSSAAERFAAGGLLGILAACGLGQYLAHWGSSGPTERGLAVVLLVGVVSGELIRRKLAWRWPVWLMLSATVSLILPWCFDLVSAALFYLPPTAAASNSGRELLGLALACCSLGLPIACWTALASTLGDDVDIPTERQPAFIWAGLGCGLGVLTNALALGPLLGSELAVIVSAALALGVSYRAAHRGNLRSLQPAAVLAPSSLLWNQVLSLLGLMCGGGALTLIRQAAQLVMTPTVYAQHAAWAVAILGIVAGCLLAPAARRPRLWGLTLIMTALALNGWMFELGLRCSLWSSAYLIHAPLHQLALVAMLAAAIVPVSLGTGLLLDAPRSRGWTGKIVCVLAGAAVVQELALSLTWATLAVPLVGGLTLLAALSCAAERMWLTRRQAGFAVTALVCGTCAAWFQPTIEPTRPAKLLFSTQAFLAYRSGWDARMLAQLDDSRLIAQRTSRRGPLTLWKSRGTDLLLREAGIPRHAIASRPALSPQAPSEVLQAVFSVLVADESRNVLLLGSSGGVPLATLLSFPIEQVTCVEPETARVDLLRGPIATEQGFDACADDRVQWDRRPVEIAAAMSDGGYDLILSSPPLSSTAAAAPQFTTEFYRNVSRKLAESGLFCQRLEGIDYGPLPVQLVVKSLQAAFRDVVAVEIGVGELLFLATNSERGLVPQNLPERLETPHVRSVLARCGWDWSTLLTLPAWDHAALKEFAQDGPWQANSAANGNLAFAAPLDVLRWGPKLQAVQTLLTKPRKEAVAGQATQPPASRRARYLDWLEPGMVSHDVLRRLSEVAAQEKIIHDNPDTCWLEYRKALRDELQQRPRTEIRQVAATEETERVLHREDERRKAYFVALGTAGDLDHKNLEAVYELEGFFVPFDPLMSLFARQEMAELLKLYGHPDPATELALRLHVIQFAPASDCSLRNVISAADLILQHPDAVADPQARFDALNGLLQTLRTRWEVRSGAQVKSLRLAIQDAERSLVTVEKMVAAMDQLIASAQANTDDWNARKDVIDRVLLRPLRHYRAELLPVQQENKALTEAAAMTGKKKPK